jgi:hypothetical protein
MHDIIGHHNRFDVCSLHHNTTLQAPVVFSAPLDRATPLQGPWQRDEVNVSVSPKSRPAV